MEDYRKRFMNTAIDTYFNSSYKNMVSFFAEEEKIWVQKANQTVTPDDVIDLAKELFAFMQENPETQDKTGNTDDSEGTDGQMMETPTSGGQEESDDTDGQPTPSAGQETGDDETDTTSAGQEESDETGDDKSTGCGPPRAGA